MSDDQIIVMKGGPLKVPAHLAVIRRALGDPASGQTWVEEEVDTAGRVSKGIVNLCRCGHSADKPFCDGSHRRECFEDG